ncbi:unnamed protein product [Acanthoscelides obtectus]|uniref:Uncharacterized protein n=1 Tax=Acanthoscelides obtectus TaxID=200917 RepID=A0A9P0PE77_ACAOB|nr:unnamed protein product [Acanthoscelides obtectus]CAK1633077.1 hypothetical protein AOBTE_LOCUS7929 [Acanthoscelides obtectus]
MYFLKEYRSTQQNYQSNGSSLCHGVRRWYFIGSSYSINGNIDVQCFLEAIISCIVAINASLPPAPADPQATIVFGG